MRDLINSMFADGKLQEALEIIRDEMPLAIWESFYMTVIATAAAIAIGLPLGIILVTGEKDGIMPIPTILYKGLNALINLLRSVPFLILIIMVTPLTRFIVDTVVGTGASVVPLVVASFPFVARLVETSIREVDSNVIEAAVSMGATPMQIVRRVLISESLPSLISNFTIAITTILGYSAMSAILGGGGLGKIAINYGYYRRKTLVMIVAVALIVLMVQLFQTIGSKLASMCDKRL
jgi:ABC-type metal ion transport system, permease component